MNRIDHERRTVEMMIRLYCRHKEENETLCDNCRELMEYARTRLGNCHYGNDKPTCRLCPIHCYRKDMRERIREVMRYAGPRMMLYHPWDAIVHLYHEWTNRKPTKPQKRP